MLPPFIIEQIRQREEEERREQRPFLELPLPVAPPRPAAPRYDQDDADRGVVVIDLMG